MLAQLDPIAVLMAVLGLGALIFFHELGHFLACRLTGTRVEAFSIGFGPKLWGWRRGPTLYKISAIPLGGYVKMAVENPGERGTGAPDELPSKSFLQRLLIYSAGVIFNVLLGFVLFVWAFRTGVEFQRAEVGRVDPGSPAWTAGLRAGDVITHVDGDRIFDFGDLVTEIAFTGADRAVVLTVQRGGESVEIPVRPRYDETAGVAQIGLEPAVERPVARVVEDSPAARAGLRPGDVVLAVNGRPTPDAAAAVHALQDLALASADTERAEAVLSVRRAGGEEEQLRLELPVAREPQIGVLGAEGTVVHTLARGRPLAERFRAGDEIVSIDGEPLVDLALLRWGDAYERIERVVVRRDGEETELALGPDARMQDLLDAVAGRRDPSSTRIVPRPGSPADRAGLRPGDRIVAIAGEEVDAWPEMTRALAEHGMEPVEVRVVRGGEEHAFRIEPAPRPAPGGAGIVYEFVQRVQHEDDVVAALGVGLRRTALTMEKVALTLKSLLTRDISARHVGGPLTLAEVGYRTWEKGLGYFLYMMALISVNLAILNLLPIPVLDGGQIVLLVVERLRGRPLGPRAIGAFQMVGLVLLLGLMALALTNDVTRLFFSN